MKKRDCEENYLEMPFKVFAKMFPEQAKMLPFYENFYSDPNYIVRLKENSISIGYTHDAWNIE